MLILKNFLSKYFLEQLVEFSRKCSFSTLFNQANLAGNIFGNVDRNKVKRTSRYSVTGVFFARCAAVANITLNLRTITDGLLESRDL